MASYLTVDQTVYVPRSIIGLSANSLAALYQTTVVQRKDKGRSVKVKLPGNAISNWIASSKVASSTGILIVRIGDFDEGTLIDPLHKSVLHFCRMLVDDNSLRAIEIRSVKELEHYWVMYHTVYSQVVLVGHASGKSITFGADSITVQALVDVLKTPNPGQKEIISLCCETGKASFGSIISKEGWCQSFIAPFHSVHGSIASQFCQAYLTNRLLKADSVAVAFKAARRNVIETASFRLWQNGSFTTS